ncbi:MAG: hypothetical protein A4E55_00904 [Pelotomaculum sp. PtaU1.Bin035]|nr:MAG: hypothetical protein A4E55_00904 [Pelotomaculum sp. PtaU1.Bin035]
MVKKNFIRFVLVLLCFFVIPPALTVLIHSSSAEPIRTVRVGLLAGDCQTEQGKLLLAAYEQLLNEEGFPYQIVSPGELLEYGSAGIKENFEGLVIPEFINSTMPPEVAEVIKAYVREYGGLALLVFDPATLTSGGVQRQAPLLDDLAGVRYYLPVPEGQKPTYSGYWYFTSSGKGREWGIPPGKLDEENAVNSYSYGKIKFEHSRAVNVDAQVDAFDRDGDSNIPVITKKYYESGGLAVYVNIPLGKYKLSSDDLTARSVLRTYLINDVKIPRLVNSPGGKGGIVFNLHICSGAYFRALMVMMMQGLFQKDLPFSIHITAGPDTYKLGDGAGFSAENKFKGRPILEVLKNYGEIGSHGGWIHNFFAYNLEYLPQQKAAKLIDWNFSALEAVTGKKIREYSDPGGNHPFWVNSELEKLGVNAYYYAGDSGACPTHPRLDGNNTSPKIWAFPISPYQKFASLEEMERGRVPSEKVKQWLEDLIDYSAEERTIRMVYTHPSETRFCLEAIRAFEQKALSEQKNDRITVAPMSWFADFLNRYSLTRWQVEKQNGRDYIIDLENPESLKDITIAVYVGEEHKHVVWGGNIKSAEEGGWLYLTITSNLKVAHLEIRQV